MRASSTRMIGGLISHAGVALLALAVIASATGKRETVVSLRAGESAQVLGQTVSFIGNETRSGPNRTVIAARLRVGTGASVIELSPALNVFRTSTQAIATPAIVPGPVEDLYVTLLDFNESTGVANLRVGTHPFVSWIWPAGVLIAFGGALALAGLPLARRSRLADAAAVQDHGPPVGSEPALDVVSR